MMKRWLFIFAVIVAPLLAWAAGAQSPTGAPAATTAPSGGDEITPLIQEFMKPLDAAQGDDALQQKLKERHNTAVRLLQLRVDAYHRRVGDTQSIFDAARLVEQAKLDLAQSRDERQTVLEQLVEVTKVVESRLQRQFESGFGSEGELQRAKLARETAEIDLLKLKQASTT